MRKIDTLVIHTSATFPEQRVTVETIRQWHLARGFEDIGYHFVVYTDGSIHAGRPAEKTGAHTLHWNSRSLGICYIGGLDEQGRPSDTRTPQQRKALRELIADLLRTYPDIRHIYGHCDLAPKACPCFNAREEYGGMISLR
ncbi:MAG: N-acetylmuramoyl-L-alanine amidase [Bacteroidaceae bacterium]|nr:N-acetylmuramoyl-L-alanine amidase [Bacteroidaceae bacterium]